MWQNKRFLLIALDRVCDIYKDNTGIAIDQELLGDAFAQAQSAMLTEALQKTLP